MHKIVIYQKNMSKGTESEEKDQEDDDEDVCPNCKKKGKNILLHIKKSNECKTAVGKEDLIRLKEKSEKKRREKKQIYWKKIREAAHEKMKLDQIKRKQKSRANASKDSSELEKATSYMYKKIQRHDEKEKKIEVGLSSRNENVSWNIEDGTCPSCKKKKKNVLLHVKKREVCKVLVSKTHMQQLVDDSKERRRKRARLFKIKAQVVKSDKHKKIVSHIDNSEENTSDKCEVSKSKTKRVRKPKHQDLAALRKHQREKTAKCRAKQKKEDPELYKARQQMWKFKATPVHRDDLMKVPKNLLKNYHRLDKYYNELTDRDIEEHETKGMFPIRTQMKILNDEKMSNKEKKEKLTKLYNNFSARDRRERENRKEKERQQVMNDKMNFGIIKPISIVYGYGGIPTNWNTCGKMFQRINSYEVEITSDEAEEIRNKGKYTLWNKFVKEKRLKDRYTYIVEEDMSFWDEDKLTKMRKFRTLREKGENVKLIWKNHGYWIKNIDESDSNNGNTDSDENDESEEINVQENKDQKEEDDDKCNNEENNEIEGEDTEESDEDDEEKDDAWLRRKMILEGIEISESDEESEEEEEITEYTDEQKK